MNTAEDQKPASPAQRQKARLDAFMGAIEKRQDQIGTLLADSGIDPRLFLETCRRALMRDPELVNTDPAAFIQAALNCAADGLVPDGRKAAIVRYKSSAQYVPMYQGLLDIAYRSGNFQSIEARVVYEGDDFDYDLGDDPFIRHKRSLEATTDKIIGAYAIARTTNGGIFREVMGAKELAKVRAVSKAKNGPNADWPGEMARKAPLRRLWKYLPKTAAMDRVALHDDDAYDQTALSPQADTGRRLTPGFNPPALAHQPGEDITPTVDEVIEGDLAPADAADEADDFPGDRPATAGAEPEALPADDEDPETWARELIDNAEAFEASSEIDALFADPVAKARFTRLQAENPTIARQLEATLKSRQKALVAKERDAAEASR